MLRKVQIVKSPEESADATLVDISNRLKDAKIRKILFDHLATVPDGLSKILNFHETMRGAISAQPIHFDRILEIFKDELQYPVNSYRDSTMEADGAERAARRIIKMISNELL
ncbi:hypothetical protein BDZ45DRAFT_417701 [Acephala macrosclerotiorum]|nr:hypothetical protein BDZ45DRAFT_417701 [Acephala macrosclerotiorum]